MTSFKRKLYDRANHRGFYQPKRDRDGNVVLKYGRHTQVLMVAAETECAACDGNCPAGTCALEARRNRFLEG